MNWLDIVLTIILALAIFQGLRIGIIKTVIVLAGMALGIILAGQHYGTLSQGLFSFISNESLAQIVSFAAILIIVLVIAYILASVVRKLVRMIMLGWVDRVGGAIFGLLTGGLICGTALAALGKFPFFDMETIISQSSLALILLERFPIVLTILPEEFDTLRNLFQ